MKLSMIVSLIVLSGCAAGVDLPPDDEVIVSEAPAAQKPPSTPTKAKPTPESTNDRKCYSSSELVGNCLLITTQCEGQPEKLVVDCMPMGNPLQPGDYIPDPAPPWADRKANK